jgi:hypothetical protein
MTEPTAILLVCVVCKGRYWAATVDALLHRRCLCGGELRA